MAHFAKLNNENQVLEVLVVHNNECIDPVTQQESEAVGVQFLASLFGSEFRCKQTSYNGNIRKNYAGIGYTYDEQRDAFIPPKPFASWSLDEETCQWQAPTQYPDDGKRYQWDEVTVAWTEIVNPEGE